MHPWLVEAASADERYRGLRGLHEPAEGDRAAGLDGADLLLYITREYGERETQPPADGPSVGEAVRRLRQHLSRDEEGAA